MAHQIETMAYANQCPWHGLGIQVSDTMTPAEIAIAAGLNWTLEKLPVYNNFAGAFTQVDNRFNLTRMTDGFVMDVVSDLYKPVQPLAAMEFFDRFITAGQMKMETAGSLDHGRRVWALAAIGKGFTLAGGDTVCGYLLMSSPNKAGESLAIKFVATRVVCANTMAVALGETNNTVRLNHLTDMSLNRRDQAMKALGIATEQLENFEQAATLLSATQADEKQVLEFVARVSGSKILESAIAQAQPPAEGGFLGSIIAATEAVGLQREIRETDLNRVGKKILDSILNSPGSDMKSAQNTWWGALNGVTYATDHLLGRDDTRLNSAWYGEKATMKEKAMTLAVEYASKA